MRMQLGVFTFGLILLLGALSTAANADSITLRDGHHIQGKFAGGTQGVIAFSVSGVTQYYEVSNILVMTFEGEGTETPGTPGLQTPSVIPEPGSIQPQKLNSNSGKAKINATKTEKSRQKRAVRLVMVAQRSE